MTASTADTAPLVPPGYRSFGITSAVQAWVDGERVNDGVILKYDNEAAGTTQVFSSVDNTANRPVLVIQWQPLQAVRDPYAYERFSLTERRQALVNVASGNLTVSEADLAIPGTGLAATLERRYSSRGHHLLSAGKHWSMWPQSQERLEVLAQGDVRWKGGPEEALMFLANPDGSYASPHGFRATLTKEPDASWRLFMHETALTYRFSSGGYPSEIADRNNNRITFAYTFDAASGSYVMASMTDTQGRVSTFTRTGANPVSTLTDPAGRTHRYAYVTDAEGDLALATYTDPAGEADPLRLRRPGRPVTKTTGGSTFSASYDAASNLAAVTEPAGTTSYAYDDANRLTRLTEPDGAQSTFSSDAAGRRTGVTQALTYDASGRQTGIRATKGAAVLSDLTYAYAGSSRRRLHPALSTHHPGGEPPPTPTTSSTAWCQPPARGGASPTAMTPTPTAPRPAWVGW